MRNTILNGIKIAIFFQKIAQRRRAFPPDPNSLRRQGALPPDPCL